MPTEFTNDEFKQILDHNKIQHARAERMKSRRDGRSLQIELRDPAKPRQLFQLTLHAHKQGLFLRWKNFVLPFRSGSVITAKISDNRPKIVRQKLNVSSVEKPLTQRIPKQRKMQPKCANWKGPHVANYKRCPTYKKQVFRQHVVDNQKCYASILKQNSAPPPQPKDDTFSFTADQLVKLVATVAIQIAQPQVCYSNAPKDAVEKSQVCVDEFPKQPKVN